MAAASPLGSLRIATPADVLRIGIVAAAGFRYSPVFRWERPHHEQHPGDTLLSYRTQFRDAIRSDEFVVLVQEDTYNPHKNEQTTAIIPRDNGWAPPEAGGKVVVGVVSLKLEPDSVCRGQLKNHQGSYPDLPENPGRDLNRRHYDSWGALGAATRREKNLDGDSIVSMLVVHPAYWRRGHGSRMVAWAKELSRLDIVPQCVSSAIMSRGLFLSFGFERLCTITAEGDEDDPEGVSIELLEFDRATPGVSDEEV